MVREKAVGKLEILKEEQIETFVEDLIRSLSLKEKIEILSGGYDKKAFEESLVRTTEDGRTEFAYNRDPFPSGAITTLDFTPVRFVDGPRGIASGTSTCFPVSMARGASFDPRLEERIGEAVGREARAHGANYYAGVNINILRHPAQGRAQETYGEDMHHLGEMGAALVRGVQKHNVMACVKHLACNNIENTRFKVNVELDDRTLHEVYLPHFKRCVDEGAASVMGAYNKVRGDHCCESRLLLTDILRGQWGFTGFTLSDFVFGVYDAAKAINAGMDVEMPMKLHYRDNLERCVAEGSVEETDIDDAVRRLLITSLKFHVRKDPAEYNREIICSKEHIDLAREAAEKGCVLLKNDQRLLPLDTDKIKRIALIGKLADVENTGDRGSSWVKAPYVVTPHQGIKALLKDKRIDLITCFDNTDPRRVADMAKDADVVIAVVGCTHNDEGEFIDEEHTGNEVRNAIVSNDTSQRDCAGLLGGDRKSIRITEEEISLIKALAKVNRNIVLVSIAGSALIYEDILDDVGAILMAWYPGMEGGRAIANILFGIVNPSGRLPCTFPVSESDLPEMDSVSMQVRYDYHHGYMFLDKHRKEARYPFGFGLSYTTYEYADPKAGLAQDALVVSVNVSNTGRFDGEEVVQVYVGAASSKFERHPKLLKGFQKAFVPKGETRTVEIRIPLDALAMYDDERRQWEVEKTLYSVYVGGSSAEKNLVKLPIDMGGMP